MYRSVYIDIINIYFISTEYSYSYFTIPNLLLGYCTYIWDPGGQRQRNQKTDPCPRQRQAKEEKKGLDLNIKEKKKEKKNTNVIMQRSKVRCSLVGEIM